MSIIEESFIVGMSYQPYINKLFVFIIVFAVYYRLWYSI